MIHEYIENFEKIVRNTVIIDSDNQIIEYSRAYGSITDKISMLYKTANTIFLLGNGGSSAIASHSGVDIVNTCKLKAYPLTEHSLLTCMSNDFGYENVFKKTLELLLTPGDVVIAISSSGSSINILNAADFAMKNQAFLITFSGFNEDNALRKMGHYNFWLNSSDYGKVEIGHALLLHILTDELGKKIDVFSD